MGVFLLFDESHRLVEFRELGTGDFGATDPWQVFCPDPRDERKKTHACLELAPEILLQIRPPVWAGLVGNAVLQDRKLLVDEVETIRVRGQRLAAEQAEAQAWSLAREQAVMEITRKVFPGPVPAQVDHAYAQLNARVREVLALSVELREGRRRAQIAPAVIDLAGQELPL